MWIFCFHKGEKPQSSDLSDIGLNLWGWTPRMKHKAFRSPSPGQTTKILRKSSVSVFPVSMERRVPEEPQHVWGTLPDTPLISLEQYKKTLHCACMWNYSCNRNAFLKFKLLRNGQKLEFEFTRKPQVPSHVVFNSSPHPSLSSLNTQ